MLRAVSVCVVSKSSLLLRKDLKNTQVRAAEDRALCLLGPWQPLETISSLFSQGWSHSSSEVLCVAFYICRKIPCCLIGPDLFAALWGVLKLCSEVLVHVLWGARVKRQLAKFSSGWVRILLALAMPAWLVGMSWPCSSVSLALCWECNNGDCILLLPRCQEGQEECPHVPLQLEASIPAM